jgi:hypothetical protein
MQKTFIILSLFLLFFITKVDADITIQVPEVTYTPGTEFTIPFIIYGASEEGTPISSVYIVMTFDTAALQYMQFLNFNPLMPQNQWFFNGNNNSGLVAANWSHPLLETVALPDGTVLFEVKFTAEPGSTPLNIITYEFLDADFNVVPTTPDNGSYASIQQVTFQVDMRDQDVSADGVHLAGSFNGWSTTATAMVNDSVAKYSVTLAMISDSDYYYRFVNGNTAGGYEIVPAECGLPSGNDFNRNIIIPAGDSLLPPVCFSSCTLCPPQAEVTFQVDMSQQNLSPNGVHLSGSFNNWDPAANLMNNLGNDIFGITLPLIVGSEAEYRFVNGNTTAGYEIVPAECGVPAGGGLYNRFIQVPETDTTLLAVCFSNCSECLTIQTVTFKLDMSQENVGPEGVHLAGSFNGFNPDALSMTNQGNDVYFVALDLLQNELITYRFVNGNDESEFETVPEECGIDDGNGTFNRYLTVPGSPTILNEVCFSSCEDCTLQPWQKNVTFQVDMSNELISEDGIHLAGTFNDWDPAATPMIPMGNNLYFITLILTENDIHQYRFVNGNTSVGYEIVPEGCGFSGSSGGLERQIIIPSVDTTLEAICFSMCDPCDVGLDDMYAEPAVGKIYPNPADQMIRIPMSLPETARIDLFILDATGMVFIKENVSVSAGNQEYTISISHLPPGMYFINIMIAGKGFSSQTSHKLIIIR